MSATIQLDESGAGAARARHPWIFSGAITRVVGDPEPGAEVDVLGPDRVFLGRGLYNPKSQIRVRLYTHEEVPLDGAFFAARIRKAIDLRRSTLRLDARDGACRLVFSEGDDLSGLTVDRYGDHVVVVLTSLGVAGRLDAILDTLEETVRPASITLRTEKGVGEEEGLIIQDGPLRGTAPEAPIVVTEGSLRFAVDLRTGQKTGFYLDQRQNRARAAAYAAGRTVADVCAYTGGFSVSATAGGATRAIAVDASAGALDLAGKNAELNGVGDEVERVRGDAFGWLGEQRDAGRAFDMIVLDPPRFARSRKGLRSALQGYERLNRLAIECMVEGGVLVTFSCSGRVTAEEFQDAVARAATPTGRTVRILERLTQAPDHPVSTACPQTAYLKGFVCEVD